MLRHAPAVLVLLLIATVQVQAAPGDLDPTFGTGGTVTLAPSDNTIGGYVAGLPGGGAVVVATTDDRTSLFFPDRRTVVVAELRADGSLDPAFGNGGIGRYVFETGGDPDQASAQAFARQPDGRLVIAGGSVIRYPRSTKLGLMRLLPNGALDPTFGTGGIVLIEPVADERVIDLMVEPDGHILVGGDAAVGDHRQFIVRRLDAGGALDAAFGLGGVVLTAPAPDTSNQLAALVRWSDGSIGAVGVAFAIADDASMTVATRLRADGQLDETFGGTGTVVLANGEWPVAAALTSDGRLVVATASFGALRFLRDGTLDPHFGLGGLARVPFPGSFPGFAADAFAIALDDQGGVLMGGEAPSNHSFPYSFALARLTTDGLPDENFGTHGITMTPIGETAVIIRLALQSDGRVVAAGFARPPAPQGNVLAIARYDTGVVSGPGGCALASGRLLVSQLGVQQGGQQLELATTFPIMAGTTIDPVTSGVHLTLASSDGTPLLDSLAPPGRIHPGARVGWRTRRENHVWTFADRTGATGLRRILVRLIDAQTLRVRVRAQTARTVAPGALPPRLTLDLPAAACGTLAFPLEHCRYQAAGDRLACH